MDSALVSAAGLIPWLAISLVAEDVEKASLAPVIELEIPEFGQGRYAPGVLRVPDPERIRRLVLRIPATRVHRVFPKINTIGTGLVQRIRSRRDEVVCEIDLLLHEGRHYALGAADNIVEVKMVPRSGAEPVYASWVIAPPKEPQSWEAHERPASEGTSLAQAEMGAEGVVVFEELEDGRLAKLEQGHTIARRIVVGASFRRKEESVALRIRWVGEDGDEMRFSVGDWRVGNAARGVKAGGGAALEGVVDLAVGQNRVEVEVVHGTRVLQRSTLRILRRAPTEPTAVPGEKWAVVIGISDYHSEGLDLRYARRDAQEVRDFLIGKAGFGSERVRLLADEGATVQEIRTALFTMLAATQPEDLVLIFLAGHGVQDAVNPDNFFFLAHDSNLDNLGGTAIPMWDLGNVMDYSIRARRILVLADTCHSGSVLGRAGGGAGAKLNFFNKYLEVLARKKGRLVVTASQAHERSLESTDLAHGVFTHHLLAGLGGLADDNPADGAITASELVEYLQAKVPEETQGEQHPSYSQTAFDMNLPLAYVRPDQPSSR